MGEIYKDEIERNLNRDQEPDEGSQGGVNHQNQAEKILGIQKKMLDGNNELGQDEDAAYHLNVELHNQHRFNQRVEYKEIRQADQVQFDEQAYLERKKMQEEILGKRSGINPTKNALKNNQLSAMAMSQIRKDFLGA